MTTLLFGPSMGDICVRQHIWAWMIGGYFVVEISNGPMIESDGLRCDVNEVLFEVGMVLIFKDVCTEWIPSLYAIII